MPARLREMIPLMQFSSGSRTVVYERMRALAQPRGLTAVVQHIDRALAHERHTRELENHWSSRNRGLLHPDRLLPLDNRLDQKLTGVRDIADGHARGLPDDHPLVDKVARFLAAVFPNGVLAVSSLPFVDQVLAVEAILLTLQGDMAAIAAELGLQAKIQQLAEMTAEYRRLVNEGRSEIAYQAVREARVRGQAYLREIISLVLGAFFDSDDPAHVAGRDELLAPVSDHLAILHARAKARRRGNRPDDDAEALPGDEGDAVQDDDPAEADGTDTGPVDTGALVPAEAPAEA